MKLCKGSVVFAVSLMIAIQAQSDVRQGLVSYWPLDTLNGATAPDLAVGNNMTVTGSPSLVPGTNGNAFPFTTSSNYLSIAHGTNNATNGLPILLGGSYTVMLWVKGSPVANNNSNDRYL